MRSPSLYSSRPRCVGVMVAHGPDVNARCAARTARSTSSEVALGTRVQTLPVNGSMLSKYAPFEAALDWPSTYRAKVSTCWLRSYTGPPGRLLYYRRTPL